VPSRDRTHEQVIQFDNAVYRSGDDPHNPVPDSKPHSRSWEYAALRLRRPFDPYRAERESGSSNTCGEWISLSCPTLPVPERSDIATEDDWRRSSWWPRRLFRPVSLTPVIVSRAKAADGNGA
jgi:hypothetical protein